MSQLRVRLRVFLVESIIGGVPNISSYQKLSFVSQVTLLQVYSVNQNFLTEVSWENGQWNAWDFPWEIPYFN